MPALRAIRRHAAVSAAGLLAGLALAAPASADVTQSIDVTVKPSGRGNAAKLTMKWRTSDTRRVKPPSPTAVVISLPRGVGFDRRAAARTCAISRLQAGRSCPKSSVIGGGRAFIDVRVGGFDRFTVPVQAYMAPRQGSERARILVNVFEPQSSTRLVLTGRVVTRSSGAFGTQLRFDPIPALSPVQGTTPALIGLDLGLKGKRTVTRRGRRSVYNFFRNPGRCSGGFWPYAGAFSFASGLRLTAGDAVACGG